MKEKPLSKSTQIVDRRLGFSEKELTVLDEAGISRVDDIITKTKKQLFELLGNYYAPKIVGKLEKNDFFLKNEQHPIDYDKIPPARRTVLRAQGFEHYEQIAAFGSEIDFRSIKNLWEETSDLIVREMTRRKIEFCKPSFTNGEPIKEFVKKRKKAALASQWRQKNPERQKELESARHQRDREKRKEQKRMTYQENPDYYTKLERMRRRAGVPKEFPSAEELGGRTGTPIDIDKITLKQWEALKKLGIYFYEDLQAMSKFEFRLLERIKKQTCDEIEALMGKREFAFQPFNVELREGETFEDVVYRERKRRAAAKRLQSFSEDEMEQFRTRRRENYAAKKAGISSTESAEQKKDAR